MKQLTLAAVGFERYAKTTRRAAFLAEMERVVPWTALYVVIEPFYPKPGNGRPPIGVERMLRLYSRKEPVVVFASLRCSVERASRLRGTRDDRNVVRVAGRLTGDQLLESIFRHRRSYKPDHSDRSGAER